MSEETKKKIEECLHECEIPSDAVMAITSLDLVSLAVKLEKNFKIRFELDEINDKNFNTIEQIQKLIERKTNS